MPKQSQTIPHPRTDEFTLLIKLRGDRVWHTVSNPTWHPPHHEGHAAAMLKNWSVEYVEWCNGGAIHRVIRTGHLKAYKVE